MSHFCCISVNVLLGSFKLQCTCIVIIFSPLSHDLTLKNDVHSVTLSNVKCAHVCVLGVQLLMVFIMVGHGFCKIW